MPKQYEVDDRIGNLFKDINPEESTPALARGVVVESARPQPQSVRRKGVYILLLAVAILLMIGFALFRTTSSIASPEQSIPTLPGPTPAALTANLREISGTVTYRPAGLTEFLPVLPDQIITIQSSVKTARQSRVRLDLSNQSIVRLGENTLFVLQDEQQAKGGARYRVNLGIGEIWIILRDGSLEVETPSGLAAVRGSFLHVEYYPETRLTRLTCLEGACSVKNESGQVDLVAGETGSVYDPALAPVAGRMDKNDINAWLQNNPEATLVIPPLRKTAAALPSLTAGAAVSMPVTATATLLLPPTLRSTSTPVAGLLPVKTATITATLTPGASLTASQTVTPSVTRTALPSVSPTPTKTRTAVTFFTVTPRVTASPSLTASATITSTRTVTPTVTRTHTGTPTVVANPLTHTPTATKPAPTQTVTASATLAHTASPTATFLPTLTATPPAPTGTPTVTPTAPVITCKVITQIPTVECEALAAFYAATNGAGWGISSGWFVTDQPCSWYGVTCLNGNTVELQMAGNKLSGSLPAQLGNLSKLKQLLLDHNQLTGGIPQEVGNLSGLTNLDLSFNQFSDVIPAKLGGLTNLTLLYLENNQLSGLLSQDMCKLVSLHSLRLSDNVLSGPLPACVTSLSGLTYIRLGGVNNTLDALTVDATIRAFLDSKDANWASVAP